MPECRQTISLRFRTWETESFFVKSQTEHLLRNLFWFLLLSILASAMILATLPFLQGATPTDLRVTRSKQLAMTSCIACALLSLVSSIASKWPRLHKCVSPEFREIVAVTVLMFLAVMPFLVSPFYGATILAYNPREVWASDMKLSDTRPILILSTLTTASHLTLPIRWIVLFPLEIFTIAVYAAFALILGGPDGAGAWVTLGLYTGLVLVSAIGRRTIESHQREALSQLIRERKLRAETEFRLTRLEQRSTHGRRQSRGEDELSTQHSRPETTLSAQAFQSAAQSGDVQSVLEVGRHEQWLIDRKELTLMAEQVLGKGGFGVVVAGRYAGAPVAVKLMPEVSSRLHECLGSIIHEIRVLRRLHHPGIVSFFGACIDIENGSASLVLEWVQGLCLERFILQGGVVNCPLTAVDRLKAMLDTCWAVCYLHSREPAIVHGDLKGTNIIMAQDPFSFNSFRAKLLDFGLSRVLTRHVGGMGGSAMWVAPEVVRGRPAHSKADIFSFGRVSFFILTGKCPLADFSRKQILRFLKAGSLPRLPWPDTGSRLAEECRWWIEACSEIEPTRRPRIEDVAEALTKTLQKLDGSADDVESSEDGALPASQAAQFDQDPVAEVVLDASMGGRPIKECSPEFTLQFGHVAPSTNFSWLVKNVADFEKWLQSSLNALMYHDETPDLRIALKVPQGLVKATCRVVPESSTRVEEGEVEDDDESRASLDTTHVRIRFFNIRHSQGDSTNTKDSKESPTSHVSL